MTAFIFRYRIAVAVRSKKERQAGSVPVPVPMRFPILAKLTLTIGMISTGLIALNTYNQYRGDYESLEDKFGLTLKHIAINAAAGIRGEDHRQIHHPDHFQLPAFQRIRDHLKQVQMINYLEYDHIYTFEPGSNRELIFCVMLHEKPFIGHKYAVPPVNREIVARALAGHPGQTRVYQDEHGTWISAFAPIKTADGSVAGILAVDYDVEKFYMALDEKVQGLLIQSAFILAFGLLLVFLIAINISRPIKELSVAAGQIRDGSYDGQVNISSRDEIGDLSRAFNGMTSALNEKFHMLKYISPHTREMIEQLIKKEISEEGNYRDVAIFFSDIRGFTAFSEHRDPKQVVEVLNRLLSLQSEIIERYEGKIDKYFGDEVVALFEGPTRVSDAVYAGLEIQNAIAAASESIEDRLAVGVGISIGNVIMGNIGSESRKDYTIIGSNVNLAARLCSQAGPGEVLLSSDAKREAGQDERIAHVLDFEPHGQIDLKGFSAPVHIFGVSYKR